MSTPTTATGGGAQEGHAYLLKTKAKQWAFDVHVDEQSVGGGGGYADPQEAFLAAQEAFPHLQLHAVVPEAGE